MLLQSCVDEDANDERQGSRGELGVGQFDYQCFNETDITCIDDDPRPPRAIAVGGRFDLRATQESGPQPTVYAPAMDLVRSIEGGFQVRARGEFAILALNGNREVVDLTHLRGMEIEEVRVREEDSELPSTTLRLEPQKTLRVLAVPYGAGDIKLGGAVTYAWSSSDESVVSIETLNALNRVRVRAGGKPGSAMLLIDVGSKSFTINVEVASGDVAKDAGSASDAESDGAARSDTGSDAQASGGSQ